MREREYDNHTIVYSPSGDCRPDTNIEIHTAADLAEWYQPGGSTIPFFSLEVTGVVMPEEEVFSCVTIRVREPRPHRSRIPLRDLGREIFISKEAGIKNGLLPLNYRGVFIIAPDHFIGETTA